MRTMIVRKNAGKKRRPARKTAPSRAMAVYAPKKRRKARRATGLAAPVRRHARPGLKMARKRRKAPAKLDMGMLLISGGAGAAGALGAEWAIAKAPFMYSKIESETGRALAKAAMTLGLSAAAVAVGNKSRKVKTRKMINAAALGAMSASVTKLTFTLYHEHVAKRSEVVVNGDGLEAAAVNRAGTVVPMGINAPARRGMGSPVRPGVGYTSPMTIVGRASQLSPGSVDAVGDIFNNQL